MGALFRADDVPRSRRSSAEFQALRTLAGRLLGHKQEDVASLSELRG
jgi:hypothetical protein